MQPLHSPFAALAESIVYQQLHGRAAASIFGRLCERVGQGGSLHSRGAAGHARARAARGGAVGREAAAVKDLAQKTREGTVPTLAQVRRLE